jgi:hypothetical protein
VSQPPVECRGRVEYRADDTDYCQLRASGATIAEEDLARVSPLAFAHVIPNGTYFVRQAPLQRHGEHRGDVVCGGKSDQATGTAGHSRSERLPFSFLLLQGPCGKKGAECELQGFLCGVDHGECQNGTYCVPFSP